MFINNVFKYGVLELRFQNTKDIKIIQSTEISNHRLFMRLLELLIFQSVKIIHQRRTLLTPRPPLVGVLLLMLYFCFYYAAAFYLFFVVFFPFLSLLQPPCWRPFMGLSFLHLFCWLELLFFSHDFGLKFHRILIH